VSAAGHKPAAGTPGILRRAAMFGDTIARMSANVQNPLDLVIDQPLSAVEAMIGGRPTLMFGTNSYLGLNFHPGCIRAASDACASHGTGSTASRVAAGNHRLHVELEGDIARFFARRHATIFSTGFMASLGTIAALVRDGDVVVLDAHCHASIFDAARLSGAEIKTFRHNDNTDLERLLANLPVGGDHVLVVLEGLYSVWGDLGALAGLVATAKRHCAVVAVDEAHSVGVYGKHGRGVAEELGLEESVDIVIGTFSKSMGLIGGFHATNLDALKSLRFVARSYLYTASPPPSVVAAAREALRVIAAEPQRREAMWRNARALHAGLCDLGLKLSAPPGPVGSIAMPGLRLGYEFWQGLLKRGIYVNMLIPPATPAGEVVLRYSVSAAHTPEHIDTALEAFAALASGPIPTFAFPADTTEQMSES
jgi:8-amino-7-oxononanoate synthase